MSTDRVLCPEPPDRLRWPTLMRVRRRPWWAALRQEGTPAPGGAMLRIIHPASVPLGGSLFPLCLQRLLQALRFPTTAQRSSLLSMWLLMLPVALATTAPHRSLFPTLLLMFLTASRFPTTQSHRMATTMAAGSCPPW